MSKAIKCLAMYESIATAMTRGQYNKLRGWDVPSDENPDDEGFLMQRLDQPANVCGMEGYVSWLPEKVFHDTYFVAETYLDRLMIEKEQLSERIDKLESFLDTDAFEGLSKEDRDLLKEQYDIMCNYSLVLSARIGRAKA